MTFQKISLEVTREIRLETCALDVKDNNMPNSLFSMSQKGKDSSPKIMDEPESKIVARPWKVLLIDDEPDVIAVSKMALSGLKLSLIHI